jgi:sugar phosphate permease
VRARVFGLTWLAYASYYLCRKNVSVCKSALQETLHLSTRDLGVVDTAYLWAYAVGQFSLGFATDRIGPRRMLATGMLLISILTGMCISARGVVVLAVLYGLNGFAQASGWPGTVKAMTPWFSREERGRVMGWWSTCYQIGGLVSGALIAKLLATSGWQAAFWVPALMVGAVGLLLFLALPEHPSARAESKPDPSATNANVNPASDANANANANMQARSSRLQHQLSLFRNPSLWALGLAYFCLKLIRYSLLFWLPYYLEKSLGYPREHAGYQSLAFEAGGVIGAITVGHLSDAVFRGRRALVGMLGCVGLALAFGLYAWVARLGPVPNFAALALVGAMLFGPDSVISAAAAQDLGGEGASATAAGFINGMGSIGATFQGLLTAYVANHYGWDVLFRAFFVLAAFAAVALLPLFVAERERARVAVA